MQQSALLAREQEDHAIDEPQQLLEVRRACESAVLKRFAQLVVLGMREESLSECEKRLLHAAAQMLACACPLLAPGGPPLLERAIVHRLVGPTEARLVREQPERSEVGISLL